MHGSPAHRVASILLEDESVLTDVADKIQVALDVAGLSPELFGTSADAANVAISLLRAARAEDKDTRNQHLINAGISAISLVPFADVVKLLKNRTARRAALHIARYTKTGARSMPKSYHKPAK